MRELLNKITILSKTPSFYLPFIAGLFLNALSWLMLLWRLPLTNQWIPLHFNTIFGIDWLGPWIQIYLYPLAGLIVILLNFIVNLLIFIKDKSLSIILNYSSLIFQITVTGGLLVILVKLYS